MAPVTRRRAAAQDGSQTSSQDANTAPPQPSATKAKAKRKSVGEDAPEASDILTTDTVTPKRQKLAVRAKGALSGDAPSTVKSKRSREALIADSQDSDNDDFEPTPYQVTKQLEEDARQRLSQEPNTAEPSPKPAAAAAAAKSKRIVFDNDDDIKRYVAAAAATAKKAQPAAAEQEDEDSDDEAPEAVTASAAAEESKKAAQALTDAVEKQAATTKRKRQERDNTLKQQAQKRERAKKVKPNPSKGSRADSEDDEDDEAGAEKVTTGRRRAEKFNLPSVLPAEFLTDSEDDSEDERDLRVAQKPKKIKFDDAIQTLSKEGRAPRDEIVGSTAYRVVVDQGDEKLAPRANHNSKNVKEMLLHRRRVGVAPNKANGFFKRR